MQHLTTFRRPINTLSMSLLSRFYLSLYSGYCLKFFIAIASK